jgi:hypothetical protein
MNLFDGLQLLELVKDGDVKSYLANDPDRSRNLLIHWMPLSASSEIRALLELLDSLTPAGRSLILEAGIRDGSMYFITENPAHFPGLREWLTAAAREKTAEVANPLRRSGQWQTPAPSAGLEATPPIPPPDQTAEALPVPPPAAPIEPAEGEFTRLFGATAVPVAKAPVERSPLEQSPLEQSPVEQGEFTRLFMQPAAPAAPSPRAAEPGEFTRIFLAGSSSGSIPSAAPAPPQKKEDGEFTRFFQSPLAIPTATTPSDDYFSKPEAKAPAPPEEGEFTRIFGKQGASTELPQSKEATGVFTRPPAPQPAEGPSEYTRMFAAQSQPEEPEPEPAPVSAPKPGATATPEPKSILLLILILAVLAVAALVLVFVFLRK